MSYGRVFLFLLRSARYFRGSFSDASRNNYGREQSEEWG